MAPARLTEDSATARAGGNVVNEIAYTQDGWGNVRQSDQSHHGLVFGSVVYAYDSLARLSTVLYPTTTVFGYTCDTNLSQVTAVTDGGSTHYADYTYLGAGTLIATAHAGVSGGLTLTYGTATDDYAGFDQWGHVVDHRWVDGSNADIDRYQYGHDANGNRLWKANVAASGLDELYSYDGLRVR